MAITNVSSTSILPIGSQRPNISRKQSSIHKIINAQIERTRLLSSKSISSFGNLASITDSGSGISVYGPSTIINWPATIVLKGPKKAKDYTDNRYWVKRVTITNKDNDPRSKLDFKVLDKDDDSLFRHVVVTNISEHTEATHYLPEDFIVQVFSSFDRSDPVPIIKYWMYAGFPTEVACVIREAEGFDGNFVVVQNVRLRKELLPDKIEWWTYGDFYTVLIAPGFKTRHFHSLITLEDVIITTVSTIQWKRLTQNGVWVIEAKSKRGRSLLDINVPIELVDCSVVG